MTNDKNPCCKRSSAGLFFGIALLVWGTTLLADTYLQLDLSKNLFPLFVIVLGSYLIVTGFKR